MSTRMQHERHGFTEAYDANEVARLRANGWFVPKPEQPQKPEPAADLIALEVVDAMPLEVPKRKPGRPPKVK